MQILLQSQQFYFNYLFFAALMDMNYYLIKNTLLQSNLNIDPHTIEKIHHFINNQIGIQQNFTEQNQKYIIFAALAIISEMYKIPTIDNQLMTSNGIQIEQVMNNIEGLSVETYLEFVQNIMKKYRKIDKNLIWKIRNLKLAYRIFKKYKNITKQILSLIGMQHKQLIYDLEILGWVLYLYCKHSNQNYSEIVAQTRLLSSILSFICKIMDVPLKPNQLEFLIEKQFNLKIQIQPNLSENQIKNLMNSILYKVKYIRYGDNQSTQSVLRTENLRSRFLDDLIQNYEKMKREFNFNYIDEIKFLKLTRIIPPQKINSPSDQNNNVIKFSTKKINFETLQFESPKQKDKSNGQIKIQTPIQDYPKNKSSLLVSPLLKRTGFVEISPIPNKCHQTPISSKVNQDQWINKRIETFKKNSSLLIQFLFQQVSSTYLSQIQQICNHHIQRVLKYYCLDFSNLINRRNKIYELFQSFLIGITKANQKQQRIQLIKNQHYILSLLCLVANIYFFVNSLNCGDIRQFSEQFGIQYLDVFKLINKVGKFDASMPNNIRLHLLQMQKIILLLFIWEEGIGYDILVRKEKKSYYERILQERLQKHIYNRIIEIHNAMGISQQYQEKTKSIVSYILNQKSKLLKKNYIDQIIICSLYSVIQMNIKNHQIKLEDLFKKYNSLQLSFNSHKFIIYGLQDEQMNLLEFYNNVFVMQVREAYQNSQINNKFLASPIKKEFDMHIIQNRTPLTKKLTNPESPQFFKQKKTINFDDLSPSQNNYQKKLFRKLNIIITGNKSKQINEQQKTPKFSPTPKLQRQFTFGKIEQSPTPPITLRREVSFGMIPNDNPNDNPNDSEKQKIIQQQ